MLLQDQVALITGSGRGIGCAIARLFAKEGAAVFLAARTEKELAATATEIVKDGGRGAFAAANLAEETDCKRVVSAAREKFGKIDILVNNAGHYGPVVPVESIRSRSLTKSSRCICARRFCSASWCCPRCTRAGRE